MTYHISVVGEGGETQTPEHTGRVVEKHEDCEGRVAATGAPGEVAVFSAATGSAMEPLGFAAGELAPKRGLLLLLAGAAAAGIGTGITIINPSGPTAGPDPPFR